MVEKKHADDNLDKYLNERALNRIFRPSFWGALKEFGDNDFFSDIIVDYLNVSHEVTENEITALNNHFYYIDSPIMEYQIYRFHATNIRDALFDIRDKHNNYEAKLFLKNVDQNINKGFEIILKQETVEPELRADFYGDRIVKKIENKLKKIKIKESICKYDWIFIVMWLFVLLSVCKGKLSQDEIALFKRIEGILPFDKKAIKKFIESPISESFYASDGDCYHSVLKILSLSEILGEKLQELDPRKAIDYIYKDKHSAYDNFQPVLNKNKPISEALSDAVNDIRLHFISQTLSIFERSSDRTKNYIKEVLTKLPPEINYHDLLIKKANDLIELENDIIKLERSSGIFIEIEKKLSELKQQEKRITSNLFGIVNSRY